MKSNGFHIEDREENTECGIGRFRPKCLQHFANINAFVGVYSSVGMISQILTVYVNTQVPTLERQFGLSSAQSGLLMGCNDIGFFTVVLFVSAAARYVHIPRMLSVCILLYGISGLICSLPYFVAVSRGLLPSLNIDISTTNASKENSKINLLCKPGLNLTDTVCESDMDDSTNILAAPSYPIKTLAVSLIGIGMTLQGIGKAPRGPFYLMYIDDNIDRRKTGFYTSIAIATSIFGPAIAFGVGGYFSNIYLTLEETKLPGYKGLFDMIQCLVSFVEDVNYMYCETKIEIPTHVDMNPRDPRWIGAWWLGFVVFGVISIFLASPLAFFPKQMKMSQKDIAKGRIQERTAVEECTFAEKLKMSVTSYSKIMRNPIYLLTNAMTVFNIMSVGGWHAFISKFLMTHFNIPLSLANYIMGGASIGAIASGAFLGGLLTRKITMTPRNVYRMILLTYIVSMTFLGIAMFMSCPQPTVVGPKLNVPGYVDSASQNCTPDCSCQNEEFYPICGSNKVNYHSPCFAGCQELLRNGRMFSNCSCIPDGRADAGLCDDVCPNLIPYVILVFLSSITMSMKITPTVIAIIRSVEDKDKALALGLNSCLVSGLGWALSPFLFGKMLDGTCYIWQFPCSSSGACEFYDLRLFRLSVHGISLAIRCLALLSLFCLMIMTRNWKDWKFSHKNQLPKKEADRGYTKVPSEDIKIPNEHQNTINSVKDVRIK